MLINDRFKFCEVHNNKAIWDIPNSCHFTFAPSTTVQDNYYYVLNKLSSTVEGNGYNCLMKKYKVDTYMDFFRTQTQSIDEEFIQLSREDCVEMSLHKTCNRQAMNCDSNYCEYSNKPKSEDFSYTWLKPISKTFIECQLQSQSISSETTQGKIFINAKR